MPTLFQAVQFGSTAVTQTSQLCLARSILLAIALAGCAGGQRESRTCEWLEETHYPLDLSRSADRAHLRTDAQSAETIAIHYADVSPARRQGSKEYAQARDDCMESLFGDIARNHALDIELVRAYTGVRNREFDAMVLIFFAAVYALVAAVLAGRITRSEAADDWRVAALAVIGLSVGVAFLALLVFDVWVDTAESLRLGSWHLSYRVDRLPWHHHRALFFASSVALFWLLAFLRYRGRHRLRARAA